jgi:hypothetical protein
MITVKDLPDILEKIETGKNTRAKAEALKENELARLEKEYGITSEEGIPTAITECKSNITTATAKLDILLEKIDGVADWESM